MRFIFCSIFIFCSLVLNAQNEHLKHDYIWLTGYDSNPNQLEFGGTVIDFNEDPIDVYYEYRDFDFEISNTTMCDEDGELIFSCNNNIVANKLNELMENGGGLNPEPSIVQNRMPQTILALPSPAGDSTYILFHQELTSAEDLDGNPGGIFSLYKTIIDLKFNNISNSLGRVIEKNIPILEDTLAIGRLTATRHANGRDWWILQQRYSTNKFYRFLLSPGGVTEQEPQIVGENQLYGTHGIGQAVFSPDGSIYSVFNTWDTQFPAHIDFFNFNRCTGLLNNYERFIFPTEQEHPRGLAISSNSKYAYLTTELAYYQIDLDESPKELNLIQERADTVSIAFLGQLASNGKIYFCGFGGHREMHIIHNPNEEGIACNIEQGGLSLPTYNNGTIPNHPNYRLGRLFGSPCDTIYTDTTSVVNTPSYPQTLDVFPNPSSSNISFEISEAATFKITDYLGRTVLEGRVRSGENALDVSGLVSGVYFLTLEGDVVRVARFVVQRE